MYVFPVAPFLLKPGVPYSEIGTAIHDHADKHGFGVVREFVGHGIGRAFHTTPSVMHFRNKEPNGEATTGRSSPPDSGCPSADYFAFSLAQEPCRRDTSSRSSR